LRRELRGWIVKARRAGLDEESIEALFRDAVRSARTRSPRCWRSPLRPAIPDWYHAGMSKQIAVRLADDLVEFVDRIVASGEQSSRAAVVTRALERERRRVVAARDAEILATTGPDPELAGLAEHAVHIPLDG
jgi:Arc/MetJ-type ribon-helix-helix transcriptional regulator